MLSTIAILLLKGYFAREKIILHEKNLKHRKIIVLINFNFDPTFFLSILTKFKKIMRFYTKKNAIESKAFLSKSVYIMDSNQYAIELITYLLVLVVYFYELIVYMLLKRNAFDSIAFFSQCNKS